MPEPKWHLTYSSVVCRKLRGEAASQKMCDLPGDRLEPAPPFTFCGLDCFGPFHTQDGRKQHKRYGLLFTCPALRAVHIELLDDMSTDAMLNALRRFIAIRGNVSKIRCDHGTNFVGAQRELADALKEIDSEEIRRQLADQCDFQMNTPHSSHMGGVWERQIRSIRSVLTVTINQAQGRLDISSMRTLLYEAMAIVNSRPLATDTINDPTEPEPITPNHLLTMKSSVLLPPPGNFVKEDVYARKRWKRVQYLANQFWTRWKAEYLSNLQSRQKWQKTKREIEVGDVVILHDQELPRGNWEMAIVEEAFKSSDGLIRKLKLRMPSELTRQGKRVSENPRFLERPIHKVTVLIERQNQQLGPAQPWLLSIIGCPCWMRGIFGI
ncbi:uncharacterized protein LOC135500154 [Lineus longissimus]|uniref:uncharacterized protein LOC135500154 n=1 Tax=Lineus longissimus TaxID=88925 RepID=UPI00315DF767